VNERERLAHIYDVTLTRTTAPLVSAGAMMLVPTVGLFLCAGVVIAVAVSKARDDAAIERGLDEAKDWGFSVEGYRTWLLAVDPTFDIELAHDMSIEVIRGSIAAVDRGAVVEKRGERVVRVVTQRVQLARGDVVDDVADRRLLFELRDRILAPLHADSGIVAVRMGDLATLAALVPAASTSTGAFRDQALSAPPALQQLVTATTAHARPPSEAKQRDYHDHRVLLAHGTPVSAGGAPTVLVGAAVALTPVLGPLALLAGGFAAFGVHALGARDRSARVRAIIARVNTHGFPVEGYDDFVISGRPIFDIEFAAACPRELPEQLLGGHPHRLTWIDDMLLRIETTPCLVPEQEQFAAFWGGDPRLFETMCAVLLVPLHARIGIAAVRMGGYVQRRA
jgi:hypothetical protein